MMEKLKRDKNVRRWSVVSHRLHASYDEDDESRVVVTPTTGESEMCASDPVNQKTDYGFKSLNDSNIRNINHPRFSGSVLPDVLCSTRTRSCVVSGIWCI